mmetsp:Transcript_47752/g.153762  ORF Transcript_47752/g.153762 Transcript_47752/m.153762 type:complete len:200 (-) Transcript_47752:668-1267(-)
MRVQLLKSCCSTAVIVQSLPQRAHVSCPIDLPANLEELCPLQRHAAILVQDSTPGAEQRAILSSQHEFEVVECDRAHLHVLSLLCGHLHGVLAGVLLHQVTADLHVHPLEVARVDAALTREIHNGEDGGLIATGPAQGIQSQVHLLFGENVLWCAHLLPRRSRPLLLHFRSCRGRALQLPKHVAGAFEMGATPAPEFCP